jgi:hypothetical protein
MKRTYKIGLAAAATIGVTAAGIGVAAATSSPTTAPTASCAVPTSPVYQVANPSSQASLVTRSRAEADGAAAHGFTVDGGVVFHAATAGAAGLAAVVRLYHPGNRDFLWTTDSAEAEKAVTRYGYQRQQTDFYASTSALSCTTAVTRMVKGSMHRLAVGSAVTALTGQGWTSEGVRFHAFRTPGSTTQQPTQPTRQPTPSANVRPLGSVLSGGVLGDATYTVDNFGVAKDGRTVGAVLPASGLRGGGVAASVVQMTPGTSTKAALVPPDDPANTNPMDLLMVTGTAGSMAAPTLSGFTLRGTSQGHIYNGLRMSYTRGARVTDVRVVAVPGNYHINPGETFGINDWQGHGNTYTGVEVDGAGVGASGLGVNSSDNVTVNGAHLHDNPYSAGLAAWQTTGVTLVDVRSVNNRTGLNFERVGGTVVITRPTLVGNREQDLFIGSDHGSAVYTITDPVLAPGAKVRIRLPKMEMGKPNLQSRNDIRVIVGGVDVTAGIVQWL